MSEQPQEQLPPVDTLDDSEPVALEEVDEPTAEPPADHGGQVSAQDWADRNEGVDLSPAADDGEPTAT